MNIEDAVYEEEWRDVKELALGWLRYEALRKLNPQEFSELHKRNLNGKRFDDMVDELVTNKR